ncbi:unnamed protein product, partial [Tilletia controversa]
MSKKAQQPIIDLNTYPPDGKPPNSSSTNASPTHPTSRTSAPSSGNVPMGAPISYTPGDVACLLPENDLREDERLLRRMKWEEHARRSSFALARKFTPPSHLGDDKLAEFLTPDEGTDKMVEYTQRVRRIGGGVTGVGVEWALEMFGWMQERQSSIVSAPAVAPNTIELAVAIVKDRTRLHSPRRGICASWLQRRTRLPLPHRSRYPASP